MSSYDSGKSEIVAWIKSHFPYGSTCLDVGACDGKWSELLGDYLTMDAVEIFEQNIEEHSLRSKYRNVWCGDIADYTYKWYDLIIFGDVVEHMTVEQAQKVLTYADKRCEDMIVSVPFLLPQDELYGNPYERHIQDDLTQDMFRERYPGFRILFLPSFNYAYYVKRKKKIRNKKPKFSIIIPTHNGAKRIRAALNSIIRQHFKDYELIVVCDACEDNTAEIASEYTDNIYIVDFHRDGLTRNAGLDAATGEWVLFMDDDDYYLHEYCLDLLADQAGKDKEDILDFGFVWKNVGYRYPSPDEQFVMVWCRAWRRTFIGNNRFNAEPYGSDKDFYNLMIRDNPDVTVKFWNMPLYYYNYMREGSLSWMEKKKKYLDIIVTHYNEPWEIGKPFFDMLANQHCVEKGNIEITLVQDGEEGALEWNKLFAQYPFQVNVITIPNKGVAAARNAGIAETKAPWIMFCNFDDMLGDVCSLSMYLENFPTDECDVIWSKVVQEQKWYTGTIYLNKIDGVNFSNTDGKMYRRKFLEENMICFDTTSKYYYDYIFNVTVLAIAAPFRIMTLTTDFYPYFKTFRADSFRHTDEAHLNMMQDTLDRDIAIANEFHRRNLEYNYKTSVVKALCRQYYAIYNPDNGDVKKEYSPKLIEFFRNNKDAYYNTSKTDIDPIKAEVEIEVMNFIQNYYNEHKKEYYLVNDEICFEDWINCLKCVIGPKEEEKNEDNLVLYAGDQEILTVKQAVSVTNPRVVVYCGTFDVYMNMVASVKSLLCRTPVDKVYFLIEDDKFPYELPDIVECINVSKQQYFTKDGPNYENSWTWMCMIRAAFPEIFSQYDRILSLDVDVVINDNVSDLWDYDISDYYLAGVPERQRQKTASDPTYINFGVVMMNLKKLREDGIQQPLIDALNTRHFGCPEQDAYNKFCAGHILPIPADYNYTTYSHITADAQKERIIHYAGQKFWRHYAMVKQYSDLSWHDVMKRQAKLHE